MDAFRWWKSYATQASRRISYSFLQTNTMLPLLRYKVKSPVMSSKSSRGRMAVLWTSMLGPRKQATLLLSISPEPDWLRFAFTTAYLRYILPIIVVNSVICMTKAFKKFLWEFRDGHLLLKWSSSMASVQLTGVWPRKKLAERSRCGQLVYGFSLY